MTIFLVQSGLKHDGQLYTKGSMFEGDAGTFRHLVNDGTLREIEGASSFEEAEKILAEEAEQETENGEEAIATPQDTWGPQPDAPETEDETKESENEPEKGGSFLGRLFGNKKDETTMPTEDETTNADGSVETPATTDDSAPAVETPAESTDSETGDNL